MKKLVLKQLVYKCDARYKNIEKRKSNEDKISVHDIGYQEFYSKPSCLNLAIDAINSYFDKIICLCASSVYCHTLFRFLGDAVGDASRPTWMLVVYMAMFSKSTCW